MVLPVGCAVWQQAALSQEALRGEAVCWTGGRLADRRDAEGQQAIHLAAATKMPDVVRCAPLRCVRLDMG